MTLSTSRHVWTTLIIWTCICLFGCGPRTGINNQDTVSEDTRTKLCGNAIYNSDNSADGNKLFKMYCATCHLSHSEMQLTGPGLKGIFDRLPKVSEDWFINYTLNSDSVLKSGDKHARELRKQFPKDSMPTFSGELTREKINKIISYLKEPME